MDIDLPKSKFVVMPEESRSCYPEGMEESFIDFAQKKARGLGRVHHLIYPSRLLVVRAFPPFDHPNRRKGPVEVVQRMYFMSYPFGGEPFMESDTASFTQINGAYKVGGIYQRGEGPNNYTYIMPYYPKGRIWGSVAVDSSGVRLEIAYGEDGNISSLVRPGSELSYVDTRTLHKYSEQGLDLSVMGSEGIEQGGGLTTNLDEGGFRLIIRGRDDRILDTVQFPTRVDLPGILETLCPGDTFGADPFNLAPENDRNWKNAALRRLLNIQSLGDDIPDRFAFPG